MTPHIPTALWPSDTIFAEGVPPPTLTRYDPPLGSANGAAIVVCPGGGYQMLADHEGAPVAEWLTTLGITAFVLHYRLAPLSRHPEMQDDAARAIRTVRANADAWGLDADRIGVLGFSAGGHLAATVATLFDGGKPEASDHLARVSSRPDLAVLIYPVITMQKPFAHLGVRDNLLGPNPADNLVVLLSSNLQVTPLTPPCFLVHSFDDDAVPAEHALLMALALRGADVPTEMHLYETGGHGYGLAPSDPVLGTWPTHCAAWLERQGFSEPPPYLRR